MGSEGASWDIMRSQTECQIERTVEMRSWGGRDLPHRRLVRRVRGFRRSFVEAVEAEAVGERIEFIGRRWRRVVMEFGVLTAAIVVENGGGGWRKEVVDMVIALGD